MTKTVATGLARQALRHGHFASAEGARIRCPHPACTGDHAHDATMYRTGGVKLTQSEMVRQLTDRVLDCETNQR